MLPHGLMIVHSVLIERDPCGGVQIPPGMELRDARRVHRFECNKMQIWLSWSFGGGRRCERLRMDRVQHFSNSRYQFCNLYLQF